MKKLLLLGMAVLMLASAAFAVSTGQGPTGLVCVPTAQGGESRRYQYRG